MKGSVFIKAGLIFLTVGCNTYAYLKEMNLLTFYRMKLPELVEQYQRIEEELQELKFLLISLKRPQNFLHHLENTSLCHIPTCDEIFKVDLKCQDLNRTATYE